jgi:hypothetical protein
MFARAMMQASGESPQTEASVEAPAATSQYRKATPEEMAELRRQPAVQAISRELNADPFDARIRLQE